MFEAGTKKVPGYSTQVGMSRDWVDYIGYRLWLSHVGGNESACQEERSGWILFIPRVWE